MLVNCKDCNDLVNLLCLDMFNRGLQAGCAAEAPVSDTQLRSRVKTFGVEATKRAGLKIMF